MPWPAELGLDQAVLRAETLGHSGARVWQDLALAVRSLAHNGLPEAGPRLLELYGIAADSARLRFYQLLDEFF